MATARKPTKQTASAPGTPKTPTARDVQVAAQGWADPVLECRTLGHAWRQRHATFLNPKSKSLNAPSWHVEYECTRGCLVWKWQEWNVNGAVIRRSMLYPRDDNGNPLYLLEGLGRITGELLGLVRLESVQRAGFVEASDELE